MKYLLKVCFISVMALGLSGCDLFFNTSHDDLHSFFEKEQRRTPPSVPPLPKIKKYVAYDYSASGLRAPFTPLVRFQETAISGKSVVPDLDRPKEHLEQFAIEELSMVGSLSNNDRMYALVKAPDSVHRIRVGNFLGRNHGKVISVDEVSIRLVEIVPAGAGRWIERPRAIDLIQ